MVVDQVIHEFRLPFSPMIVSNFGSGHIHDTFLLKAKEGPEHILQRINHEVFTAPHALGKNISIITNHLRNALQAAEIEEWERRCMKVIHTKDGSAVFQAENGSFWRMYECIPRVKSLDFVTQPDQAFQAAKAYGLFQRMLIGLSVDTLKPSIPRFHDINLRYDQLALAVQDGPKGRFNKARQALDIITWTKRLASPITKALNAEVLPIRVTHNDTKLNNVLLDETTGVGLCVIDLDTVMGGTILYDFGDMIRTFCCPVEEDEVKIELIQFQLDVFEAMTKGYLSEAKAFLVHEEYRLLVSSGHYMTLIMAIRFLTDYLAGDKYYKIEYPEHNLDRCRNQLMLLEQLLEHQDQMEMVVKGLM